MNPSSSSPSSASSSTDSSLFATLTPASTRSRLAFSNAFESHFKDRAAARRSGVHVAIEQVFDPEVMRFRRRFEKRAANNAQPPSLESGISFTSSGSEMETDVETANQELGMIWTGCYGFEFDTPQVPASTQFGWTVGKGRPGGGAAGSTDFLLVSRRFAREYDVSMHGIHARFNFHPDTTVFFIAKVNRAADAELTLEGAPVGSAPSMLTKSRMAVRIGSLEYTLEYTPFASTETFVRRRALHLRQYNASVLTSGLYIPPTPRPGTRTFASFTIMEPLGKGAFGKVWSACDTQGKVVAIKIQEVNKKNQASVSKEVGVLQELTELARANEGESFIIRLTQVLRASGETSEPLAAPFEDIGLVMEPVAPMTLASVDLPFLKYGMYLEVATIFRGILEALNFLHSNNWMHRDIKKDNIGLVGNPLRPILLDIGGACHTAPGAMVGPTPGAGGTVGYLSPERELVPYDAGIDVWSAGVVGYELARGRHPFRFSLNPWREGSIYEQERPRWAYKYREAVEGLDKASTTTGIDSERIVLIEPLLREMLRFPWASRSANPPRITTAAALEHPVWGGGSTPNEHLAKRTRV